MAGLWQQEGLTQVGLNDNRISPYLKCWIHQSTTLVVGAIGEGTSKDISTTWSSPFETDSLGAQEPVQKSAGLTQSLTGLTSVTTLNSQQVWEGNQPHQFTLSLQLYALVDPKNEVEAAIKALELMATPDVNDLVPLGRKPESVWINIGRNVMCGPCVIESLQVPLDGPRDKNGYLLEALVQLSIKTEKMLARADIPATYG
ncbi:hypothetical protein [Spartinivicinus poritis]|uniref:Uncharacterized protein n=1 Tax=Spartinivicinus poritis TaxID=2994640 RepID=A0ABT5UI21_9GAMM|nr:hypothetical protein [Spartinivicinus sp. A2-2]MDE1465088.1 hypothetical protein [Spartinivicinus sp. A2-2]